MRALSASSLVAVGAISILASCSLPDDYQGCTLIGCEDTISVELGDVVDEGFAATVESALVSGGFSCGAGGVTTSATDLSGDFAGDDAAFLVTCTQDGFRLAAASDVEPPSTLRVEATGASSNRVVSETFEDIDYTFSQPNGPDCEPTCFRTTLIVSDS